MFLKLEVFYLEKLFDEFCKVVFLIVLFGFFLDVKMVVLL